LAVTGFFAGLLLAGLILYRDYGVSWDEPEHHSAGVSAWNYIFKGDQTFRQDSMSNYGQVFEVTLIGLEKALGLAGNSRAVYQMRHLATFLLFYAGVVFFFLLCLQRFRNWRLGILGALILVLSPRIFADAFYNLKDLAPLSLYIIAFFTLLRLLENQNLLWAALHAFACGLLVSTRIIGIGVPLVTVVFMVLELTARRSGRQRPWRIALNLSSYLVLWAAFTVFFWPTLWVAPVRSFAGVLGVMAHFPWIRATLYLGRYLRVNQIPWHYIPVWIAVTTPVTYTLLFATGLLATISRLVRHPVRYYRNHRSDLAFACWFLGPLAAVVILHSSLYDGWRHMFFIYPAFVLFALVGVEFLLDKARTRPRARGVATAAVLAVPVVGMLQVVSFMVLNHPHENVYFNPVVASNMKWVKRNFELDYWGLSYRQGLEYIVRTDTRSSVRVQFGWGGDSVGVSILPTRDRERIKIVGEWDDPDYFLGDYRWHPYDYGYKNECFAVRVCGERIVAVYDLRPQNAAAVNSAVDTIVAKLSESPNMEFAAVIVPAACATDSFVRRRAARMAGRLMTLGEFCRSARDSGSTAKFLPALVLWVFNQEHIYLEPLMYMDDRENYISGGHRFTLIGTDSGGLVGAYVMESSD
jgi:hypothetical protein